MNGKRILISGYYGFGNTGDEAILNSMIQQIRDKVKDCFFVIVSENPEETNRMHNVNAINRLDYAMVSQEIEKSDLVILGGGGLFQDHYKIDISQLFRTPGFGMTRYADVPLMAAMHGKPLMFYSQGLGPLFSKESKTFVSYVCNLADVITTRDMASKTLLEEIGVDTRKIIVSIDPAFEIPSIEKEIIREIMLKENIPVNKKLMYISARPWVDKSIENKYIDTIADSLNYFIEKNNNVHLIFLPFQDYDEYNSDSMVCKLIIEKINQKDKCHLLSKIYHPREMAGLIKEAEFIMGMRLHSIIFAARYGVPAIALSYDPKIDGLMKELKLEEFCFDILNGKGNSLNEILKKAWENRVDIKDRIKESVAKIKKREHSADIACYLLGGPHVQVMDNDLQKEIFDRSLLQKLRDTVYRQAESMAFLQRQYQQYSSNKEFYIRQLKDQIGAIEKKNSELQHEYSNLLIQSKDLQKQYEDMQTYLQKQNQDLQKQNQDIQSQNQNLQYNIQEIIQQRNSSFSWKIAQKYDRIIGYERTKRFFGIFSSGWFYLKKIVNVVINEGSEGFTTRAKSVVKKQYNPIAFNPYSKLKLLKPIEVKIIDKDYADKLNDIKGKIKFSMVIPVKNEEKDIIMLLKSIEKQSLPPDEVIIVDGGSSDRTSELINEFKDNSIIDINLLEIISNSVSQQRNTGIRSAKYDSIVLTDTVILPSNFCLNFAGPLMEYENVDLVAGIVQAQKKNYWSRQLIWDFPNVDFNEYIPPGASMLIDKELSLKFGGFPEFLKYTGEDTLFDIAYRKHSKKWVINTKAVAYWDAPDSEEKAVKKAYVYGKGDGESGVGDFRFYFEHMINFLKGNKVEFGNPVTNAFFQGYLEGRKNRVQLMIEKDKIRGNILILSGVPFSDSGGGQRGTQLALELMKHEHKVTFCNYYPSYEKGDKVFLDIEYQYLELYSFQDFQLQDYIERHKSILDKTTVILELPHPDFIPVIEKLKSVESGISVVYDCIDNWDSTLGGNWYSKEKELEIIRFSNILMASAKTLVDRLRSLAGKDVRLIPNAVNTRLFDPAIDYSRPEDLPSGKPIAVYTGALWGEWFDWELLKHLAKNLRDINFVIIGNIPEDNPKYKELKGYENIFFLGLKNQFELPGYLYQANVCIIPFKFDKKIIKYTNPLKVYEYLAMRKPVVSIYMNELEGIPFVYLSKDYDGFIDKIKNAMNVKITDEALEKYINNNSWINRVEDIIKIVSMK